MAIVDTNCDPDLIKFVIPGNDDAIRSGALLCRIIADAVTEGRFIRENRPAKRAAEPDAALEPAVAAAPVPAAAPEPVAEAAAPSPETIEPAVVGSAPTEA